MKALFGQKSICFYYTMDRSSIISPLTTHTETANPQTHNNNNDGISWWFKLLAKGVGVIGGCGKSQELLFIYYLIF